MVRNGLAFALTLLLLAAAASAAPISQITFVNGGQEVAVDTLTFTNTSGVTNTITFAEPGSPVTPDPLDGTTFYDSYGVSFTNVNRISDFNFASGDTQGGTTPSAGGVGVINFTDDIVEVEFEWLVNASGSPITIEAFDASGALVDSFSNGNVGTSGTATLRGSATAVPEPSAALLSGLALLAVGLRRKA
jgi:hypothetical protein